MFGEMIVGGVTDMLGSTFNNYLAAEREHQARIENYELNEKAAANADARTRALYRDLQSPQALLQQIQEANLSPSLMFSGGMPGASPAHGAEGAGAAGISPTTYGVNPMEAAQIGLLAAQTEKTKAEADVIKPTAEASIESLLADAGHKRAQVKVADAQAAGLALDNYVKENTKDASIYTICELAEKAGHDAQKAYEEMRSAKVLADVNEETYKEQIVLKKKEVAALAQSITESKSLVSLREEQKREIHNSILRAWEQLDINWKELEVHQQQADTYTEWINKQIPIIEKQLEIRLKELGIEKDRMIIEAVTGTIKSLAFGAMAAASFKGGHGSDATPAAAKEVLKKGYKGGNATNKGVPIYKSDYTWAF